MTSSGVKRASLLHLLILPVLLGETISPPHLVMTQQRSNGKIEPGFPSVSTPTTTRLNTPGSCRSPSAHVASRTYTSLNTIWTSYLRAPPPPPCTIRVSEALSPDARSTPSPPRARKRAGPRRMAAGEADRFHCSPNCWENGVTICFSSLHTLPVSRARTPNSPHSHLSEKPDALLPACASSEFSKRDINK